MNAKDSSFWFLVTSFYYHDLPPSILVLMLQRASQYLKRLYQYYIFSSIIRLWIDRLTRHRSLYKIAHTSISLGLFSRRQTKSRTTAIAVAAMMTFSFDFSAFQKERQKGILKLDVLAVRTKEFGWEQKIDRGPRSLLAIVRLYWLPAFVVFKEVLNVF